MPNQDPTELEKIVELLERLHALRVGRMKAGEPGPARGEGRAKAEDVAADEEPPE